MDLNAELPYSSAPGITWLAEQVKAAIDEMVTALLKEKEDEIKHKDFCTDGINKNERAQELKARGVE